MGDVALRRKAVIPAGGYLRIRKLAASGAREGAIARALGFSPATWTRVKSRDLKAGEAFEKGRDELEQELLATLRNPQLDDSPGLSIAERVALLRQASTNGMFLLKSIFGYRDGGEATNQDSSKVNVTISLPAPSASTDDYRRVVAEVTAEKVPDAD